jgi:hypothetical protein
MSYNARDRRELAAITISLPHQYSRSEHPDVLLLPYRNSYRCILQGWQARQPGQAQLQQQGCHEAGAGKQAKQFNLTPRYDDQPCLRIPFVTPTAADALLHLQDVIIITSSDDDSDSEEPAANGKAAAMKHSTEAPADGAQKVRHRHTP